MSTRRNFGRVAKTIRKYRDELVKEGGRALREIGEEMMTDIKASRPGRGVPVDFGALRDSGRAIGPRSDATVLLTFGGPSAPYALVQHERLDFAHDVGEARYLVRGVERWRPGGSAAMRALAANARGAARRLGRS